MTYKAYFDASVQPIVRKSYISGVIKQDGKTIYAYSIEINYRRRINWVECISLIELLKRIKRLGIQDICIVGDNKSVIDRINLGCRIRTGRAIRQNQLDEEARRLLLSIPTSKLIWVKRNQNKEADRLSKGTNNHV